MQSCQHLILKIRKISTFDFENQEDFFLKHKASVTTSPCGWGSRGKAPAKVQGQGAAPPGSSWVLGIFAPRGVASL